MWVFLNDAFVSLVADRNKPENLMARARFKGDLARAFPGTGIEEVTTPDADYRFRASVPRADAIAALSAAAAGIAYHNFKSSVDEAWRHDVYLRCWTATRAEQQARAPKRRRRKPRLAAWWDDELAAASSDVDAARPGREKEEEDLP